MATDREIIEAARRLCEELDKGGAVLSKAERAEAITAIRGVIAIANFGCARAPLAEPTGDGLWYPVHADVAGEVVEISQWRREGYKTRYTVGHLGTDQVSNERGYEGVGWLAHVPPRVAP